MALWYGISVLVGFAAGGGGKERFISLIKKQFEPRQVYLYGSARSALYALLKSFHLISGSEVIVTGFTCEAVPDAVIQAGLKPLYADIDEETYCMSPESVFKKITSKTKAIVIQHTFGIAAEIDSLIAIARNHDLYVIEDCAVSLGTYLQWEVDQYIW